MARGTMYELQREKDFLNQLQEEELYEHLPDIAEFVKTEKNKEGAVCILLEEMQNWELLLEKKMTSLISFLQKSAKKIISGIVLRR